MPVERLRRLQRPPRWLSLALSLAFVAAWALIRLGAVHGLALPLTYALPLLVCIWTCDLVALWGMAVAFIALHTVRQVFLSPQGSGDLDWPAYLATLFNILGAAAVVHVLIRFREALEAALHDREATNERIRAQAAELHEQGEELAQQNEELLQQGEESSQQAEELARQNEELQSRGEEIQALNQELAARERLLHRLLDTARLPGSEKDALQHVVTATLDLFGEAIAAVVVYERDGSRLALRATAGLSAARIPESVPMASRFASLVIAEGRTASLNDASLRPDLTLLGIEGSAQPQAILASPLFSGGTAYGALAVYSRVPCEWTEEQFRLAEWLAGQCARILEMLRLHDGLRRQAALIDLSPDAILVRELDGTVRLWSKGAQRLYGWTAEEAIGRRSHELLGTRFPQPFEEISASFEREGSWNGRLVHRAKDGREVPVESRWLVERRDGEPLAVLESNVDVTLRERAEAALREADRRKDVFLATLSHELRNPLAPMRYAVELLRREPTTTDSHGAVEVLDRQLGHLVRLVDELLDLTRIQSDKVQLRIRRVELRGVVEQALEAALPAIEAKGHALSVELPEPGLLLDVDTDRLAQVFTNLLNNAARYTPTPGRITVAASSAGGEALIAVSDTGIGLAPEDRDRVFDMFTQVGGPGQGGLGVGLALVRRVMTLLGGSVTAHSTGRGAGSRFELRLPLATGAAPPEPAKTTRTEAAGSCRRVLVVEDNVDAAEMMRSLFELDGHRVRVVHDASAALAAVDAFTPEVALLDIGLPGMDGHELARRLRADPRFQDVYLVAVTGWGQERDRQLARDNGFNAHLTKPAHPEELRQLVARLPR